MNEGPGAYRLGSYDSWMDDLPDLPLTAQMRGEYLAEIKRLAKEHYLQLKIGTGDEFEEVWREAFYFEVSSTDH